MNSPRVFIIVLNWNGWENTIECLESLQQVDYSNYQMVVIDNGSTDNSIEKMVEWAEGKIPVNTKFVTYCPELKPVDYVIYTQIVAEAGGNENEYKLYNLPSARRIVFIQTAKNYGYAEGNNIGIRYALKKNTDFIFILNNDTVVDKNILTEFLLAYKNLGLACYGAKVYYYSHPERIQSSGVKFSFLKMRFIHSYTDVTYLNQIDYASGAALFLPRKIIEKVGLFDKRLLLYDESDLCYRIKKIGYKNFLVPKAIIYHKGSVSFQKSEIKIEYFDTRSKFLWVEKHLSIYWRVWLFLVFVFDLLQCIRYGVGLTKSFILKKTPVREKTNQRFLRCKMKIIGLKDYILRRFYTLP